MPPFTKEEIPHALSKSSSSSAPGPNGISYLTWKRVNAINPSILLQILSLLVSLGHHPGSLKGENGVVLDKPGKPSYESTSSFRIIVLLQPVSKILERIIAARLLLTACPRGLIHPNQCGSLPGLSTYDACLTHMNNVKTLQRPRLKVSSLFLDIKAGFDNVDNPTLARILSEGGIPLTWAPGSLPSYVSGAARWFSKVRQAPWPPSMLGSRRAPLFLHFFFLFMSLPSTLGSYED